MLLLWLGWWLRPERQLVRAQGRLISALEKRDFEKMAGLLADDYRDPWGHDKAFVIRECGQVFGQFLTLSIDREGREVRMEDRTAGLREKVTIRGFGGPFAMAAQDAVNALREPFTMRWRRRSWKPWDWELTSVEHPELRLPE